MNTLTKISIGIVSLVVLFAGFLLLTGMSVNPANNALGGANSPDLQIGGVRLYSQKTTSLAQATNTVVCTLQSPAATSTLLRATLEISSSTASTTAQSVSISNQSVSTTPYTIGKVLASTSISASTQVTLESASSTLNATALADRIFAPYSWIVFAHQPSVSNTNDTGTCQALWQTTN